MNRLTEIREYAGHDLSRAADTRALVDRVRMADLIISGILEGKTSADLVAMAEGYFAIYFSD